MIRRYGVPQPLEPIQIPERYAEMPALGALVAIVLLVGTVVYILSIAGVRL